MKIFHKQKSSPKPVGRQRPLEGRSPQSFSYYTSKRTTPTIDRSAVRNAVIPTARREIVARWVSRFGRLVLGVVLLACVVSLLQVDNKPRVAIINNSEGYALHPLASYQAAAASQLHSSLLNGNKVTINTQAVTQALKTQFPEISDASVVLPLVGHRPTIYIELTKPAMILVNADQSVVVDNRGHALVTGTSVSDLSAFKLPVVTDQSNVQLKVGDAVLGSSTVAFIQTTLAQLTAHHFAVTKLVLPAGTEELDIYLTKQPYYVKFNLHDVTSDQQVGTFLAAIQQLQEQGKVPSKYIDVRLANRAYYK